MKMSEFEFKALEKKAYTLLDRVNGLIDSARRSHMKRQQERTKRKPRRLRQQSRGRIQNRNQ